MKLSPDLQALTDTSKMPWLVRERRRETGEAVGLSDVAGTPVSPFIRYPWLATVAHTLGGSLAGTELVKALGGDRKQAALGGVAGALAGTSLDAYLNRRFAKRLKDQAARDLERMPAAERRRNVGRLLSGSRPNPLGWIIGQGAVSGGKLRALRAAAGIPVDPTTTREASLAQDALRAGMSASSLIPGRVGILFGLAGGLGYKAMDVADTLQTRRLWKQTLRDMA